VQAGATHGTCFEIGQQDTETARNLLYSYTLTQLDAGEGG
jgi:hypothetical protein